MLDLLILCCRSLVSDQTLHQMLVSATVFETVLQYFTYTLRTRVTRPWGRCRDGVEMTEKWK